MPTETGPRSAPDLTEALSIITAAQHLAAVDGALLFSFGGGSLFCFFFVEASDELMLRGSRVAGSG